MDFFELIIKELASYYQIKAIPQSEIERYRSALKDVTVDQLGRACTEAMQTCPGMPSEERLQHLCGVLSGEARGGHAFKAAIAAVAKYGAMNSVVFDDQATNVTIAETSRDWPKFCRDALDHRSYDKIVILRDRFVNIYANVYESVRGDPPTHLGGIEEIHKGPGIVHEKIYDVRTGLMKSTTPNRFEV